jgi:hypothetical protein
MKRAMREGSRKEICGPLPSAVVCIAFLSITTMMGTACEDEKGSDFQSLEMPSLVTASTVVFGSLAVGGEATQTLTIQNTGDAALRISDISLRELTVDDSGVELTVGSRWPGQAELAKGETLMLDLRYAPKDEVQDFGRLEISSNHPGGLVTVEVLTGEFAPRLYSKEQIVFRRVPPVNQDTRDTFWQRTFVRNIGTSVLRIADIQLAGAVSFAMSFPLSGESEPSSDTDVWPSELLPGEEFPMRIFFNPTDDLPTTAEILLTSDDPVKREYLVEVLGNSGAPCLRLSHEDEIQFGESVIGNASNMNVLLTNCSDTMDVEIRSLEITDDGGGAFELSEDSLPSGLPAEAAVLAPGATDTMVLKYTPTDESISRGLLRLTSNDPSKRTLEIPISGRGTNNQCPQAVARTRLLGGQRELVEVNTIPLQTVELLGGSSVDPDGSIARYEWTVTSRPMNSTARLQPSSTAMNPTLFLDLAGSYEVQLRVYDERGTIDCTEPPAVVKFLVTPDQDIHIQLVWDTPNDTDVADGWGSDVDLHYLNSGGTWFDTFFDVYYLNMTNDWGGVGPHDDPSLDIDDTDGDGPENINHHQPDGGQSYTVGVHYFDDHGFGPSDVTVRIYIRGQQAYEYRNMRMNLKDEFWDVASIEVPSYHIQAINQVRVVDPLSF